MRRAAPVCWTALISISPGNGVQRYVAFVLLLFAAPLAAQDAVPWRASYFPYLIGNPSTGLMLVGHYQLGRQAEYGVRVPYDGIFSAEAGWSTNNSRFVSVKFRAPLLVKGWRFAADAGAGREAAFGFYGFGPQGAQDVIPAGVSSRFFRVRRTRYFARGEVTHRIAGPLAVAVGTSLTHFVYSSAEDGSLFDSDYLGRPLSGNDLVGRVTLVLDTRDNEFIPGNGAFLEAGLYGGTGRYETRFYPPVAPQSGPSGSTAFTDGGYGGGYLHLRGYVSPRSGTVIAGRFAARGLGAGAPLDARYTLPGWERDVTVLGGADSHRSFRPGRFAGRGLLLASLEVRHNLLDLGDLGAVTLIGFVDGGRAFGDSGLKWTLDQWRVGGGGGVAIRILRSAPLILNFAGGPDGFVFTMGNGWAF